jgi:hypothetical protein
LSVEELAHVGDASHALSRMRSGSVTDLKK